MNIETARGVILIDVCYYVISYKKNTVFVNFFPQGDINSKNNMELQEDHGQTISYIKSLRTKLYQMQKTILLLGTSDEVMAHQVQLVDNELTLWIDYFYRIKDTEPLPPPPYVAHPCHRVLGEYSDPPEYSEFE